jgi:putative ABC transport system permease protein
MGANSFSIMTSMVKEFLKPVLIAILIAFPVGWLIVGELLRQFAYRIEIDFVVFALLGLASIVVASLTVSFHAFKATEINPVEALKIE